MQTNFKQPLACLPTYLFGYCCLLACSLAQLTAKIVNLICEPSLNFLIRPLSIMLLYQRYCSINQAERVTTAAIICIWFRSPQSFLVALLRDLRLDSFVRCCCWPGKELGTSEVSPSFSSRLTMAMNFDASITIMVMISGSQVSGLYALKSSSLCCFDDKHSIAA